MSFKLPLGDRPDLVKYVNGEPLLSTRALAYLVGVDERDMSAEITRQGGPDTFRMPARWIRQGRANQARLGTLSMAEALTRLALERESVVPDDLSELDS